jgi:hypothetical protein
MTMPTSANSKWYGRGYLPGYPQIPPRQAFFQLEDREDGTVWTIMHDEDDERIGISDVAVNRRLTGYINYFDAFSGPTMELDGVRVRLLIRNGRIGYEDFYGYDNQAGLITSRVGQTRFTCVVYTPSGFQIGGVLGWRTMEF